MRRDELTMEVLRQQAAQEEYQQARDTLALLPPADAARALTLLEVDDAARIFRLLETEAATELLAEMADEFREQLLERLEPAEIAEVVEQMPPDDATDVLQDMEPEEVQEVLAEVEPDARADLEALGSYDEETAGGIMTSEFATVPIAATAAEALQLLRTQFADVEQLNVVYIVDAEQRLVGWVSLRDLVVADPDSSVRELLERHRHWVAEHQDQEQVAHYMRLHDLDAVPVVDEQGRIVGQITLDDAAEVLDAEAAEDLQRVAGISGHETIFAPLRASIRRRLPWLLLNVPLATLASSMVHIFQHSVASVPAVVAFLPLVGGIAGNAAGQTVSVFVRGLALGEATAADVWRCVLRQSVVGASMGVVLGLLVGGMEHLWHSAGLLAVIGGVALMANCMTACLVGALLPFVLRRIGFDPAMGANLVDTAITDATGYLYVLGLTSVALGCHLL